jgi:hypothetical protein
LPLVRKKENDVSADHKILLRRLPTGRLPAAEEIEGVGSQYSEVGAMVSTQNIQAPAQAVTKSVFPAAFESST